MHSKRRMTAAKPYPISLGEVLRGSNIAATSGKRDFGHSSFRHPANCTGSPLSPSESCCRISHNSEIDLRNIPKRLPAAAHDPRPCSCVLPRGACIRALSQVRSCEEACRGQRGTDPSVPVRHRRRPTLAATASPPISQPAHRRHLAMTRAQLFALLDATPFVPPGQADAGGAGQHVFRDAPGANDAAAGGHAVGDSRRQ